MKIESDPKQYEVFLEMLRDTEGMDLILVKITGGELRLVVSVCLLSHIPPL